jgi:tetratricopeptide (TPR) repeat protein
MTIVGGIVALVLCGMGILLWQNVRNQRATEERLAAMQRQLEAATRVAAPAASPPLASSLLPPPTTTQDMSVIARRRDTRMVMDEGWKLINERNAKAATQAAEIFREGLEKVDSHNAQFYNGLGRALLISGQPRAALAAWQKGLELDPGISDMRSGIGWAYWAVGDAYQAKQAWEAALDANGQSLDAWSAMAWIYLALGETEKSKSGFQILFRSDKQNKNWIYGLQMAQARNTDPAQIGRFFPLPALGAFAAPSASAPASQP